MHGTPWVWAPVAAQTSRLITTHAARDGIKNIAHEDWYRIVCPACDRDHQGRDHRLVAIIQRSQALGLRTATLDE